MPDREKVIKGLTACRKTYCERCPYNDTDDKKSNRICLIDEMISEALALLKEQGAVEPFHKCIGNEFSLVEDSHFDYCPYCGKPITWAKQEGRCVE